MDDILIVKNKGNRMTFNGRKKARNRFSPNDYQKILNPIDHNDLAILFEDLNLLYNSPIEKAFRTYHDKKNKGFPF